MKSKLRTEFPFQYRNKELLIRTVRPYDRDRLEAGVDMMSDEALYRRFFMPIKQLSDQQLEYFTNVDQVDHLAWGILDTEHPNIPGLGIARCVRDDDNPLMAEAAVTVPDAFQGQGFGTLLLAVLHLSAAQNDIQILRSIVLAENDGFIKLLKTLDGKITASKDNILTIDQPVFSHASDIPNNVKNERFRNFINALNELMLEQSTTS